MEYKLILSSSLALLLSLLGATYAAWWSSSTSFGATIDTGVVDMRIRNGKPGHLPVYATVGDEGAFMEVDHTYDEKSVTVTIGNLYPVSKYQHGVKIGFGMQNYGSVPVKLRGIKFTKINEESEAWDYLRIYGHISLWKDRGSSSPQSIWTETFQHVYLKDLDTVVMNILKDVVVEPGYIVSFSSEDLDGNTIYIYLNPNDDGVENVQGQSVGFTAEFDWVQYNYK